MALKEVKSVREILFRWKRLYDGEWVYGDLSFHVQMGIPYVFPADGYDSPDCYEVDPSTVGQYTGLKDKNEKRIFEGDILKDFVGDVYEVFYNTEHCAYMAHCQMAHRPEKKGYYRLGDCCSLTIEVIGNVHDNPELLKANS